ncbi:MAG: hypothetical protein Q9M19_09260 [Mariprofundaceae bacterium]|nr:hypothetical protein [Mariprofundaceae bacterium]
MKALKQVLGIVAVIMMAWLTWQVWLPEDTLTEQVDVRAWLPERPDSATMKQEKWRVLTRRMVWDKAVEEFQSRLQEKSLEAIVLKRKEAVSLHVFDDPRRFAAKSQAQKAKHTWEITDVDILKQDDGQYMLGLGRFFIAQYAKERQVVLDKTMQPYTYEKHTKTIPTYRFIFPALPESEAEILWKTVQDMGAVDPVMMPESEFNARFVGNVSP